MESWEESTGEDCGSQKEDQSAKETWKERDGMWARTYSEDATKTRRNGDRVSSAREERKRRKYTHPFPDEVDVSLVCERERGSKDQFLVQSPTNSRRNKLTSLESALGDGDDLEDSSSLRVQSPVHDLEVADNRKIKGDGQNPPRGLVASKRKKTKTHPSKNSFPTASIISIDKTLSKVPSHSLGIER